MSLDFNKQLNFALLNTNVMIATYAENILQDPSLIVNKYSILGRHDHDCHYSCKEIFQWIHNLPHSSRK